MLPNWVGNYLTNSLTIQVFIHKLDLAFRSDRYRPLPPRVGKCNMQSLIERLKIRAEIRRNIKTRKSVQEGKPDRIADLLEEAALELEKKEEFIQKAFIAHPNLDLDIDNAY